MVIWSQGNVLSTEHGTEKSGEDLQILYYENSALLSKNERECFWQIIENLEAAAMSTASSSRSAHRYRYQYRIRYFEVLGFLYELYGKDIAS